MMLSYLRKGSHNNHTPLSIAECHLCNYSYKIYTTTTNMKTNNPNKEHKTEVTSLSMKTW